MTTSTVSRRAASDVGGFLAAEFLVLVLVVAAVVSVAGGFALASRPHHTWAWILAGGFEAVGFLTAAVVVDLLRQIAINTRR
jgi:hypothetical protein